MSAIPGGSAMTRAQIRVAFFVCYVFLQKRRPPGYRDSPPLVPAVERGSMVNGKGPLAARDRHKQWSLPTVRSTDILLAQPLTFS
jgi:hypothetical protein